ncbi:MAG: hypothetical protein ABSB66_08510 [Candidatus Acidiferrales bacterium]
MRYLVLLLLVAMPCWCQSTTGNADASGPCTVANSGNNNTFTINCGIGKAQGETLLKIVNQILSNQTDLEQFRGKLDEILKNLNSIQKQVNPNAVKITYTKDGYKRTVSPNMDYSSNEAFPIYEELVKLYQEQKWSEVLDRSEAQIKLRPEWFTPYVMAGIAQIHLGHNAQAIQLLEQAKDGMADNPGYDDLPQQVSTTLSQLKANP